MRNGGRTSGEIKARVGEWIVLGIEREWAERERVQPREWEGESSKLSRPPKNPSSPRHPSHHWTQAHTRPHPSPHALAKFWLKHTQVHTCNPSKACNQIRNQTWFQTTKHRALNAPRAQWIVPMNSIRWIVPEHQNTYMFQKHIQAQKTRFRGHEPHTNYVDDKHAFDAMNCMVLMFKAWWNGVCWSWSGHVMLLLLWLWSCGITHA